MAALEAIRDALAVPGRPDIRVIAKQFGVSPMTVQNVANVGEARPLAGGGQNEAPRGDFLLVPRVGVVSWPAVAMADLMPQCIWIIVRHRAEHDQAGDRCPLAIL